MFVRERVTLVNVVMFRGKTVQASVILPFKVDVLVVVTVLVMEIVMVVTALVTGVMANVIQEKALVLIVLQVVTVIIQPGRDAILLVLVVEIVTVLMQAVHRVLITLVITELFVLTVTECVMVVQLVGIIIAVAIDQMVRVQKVAGLVKDVTMRVRQVVIPAAKV